jgi:hypothetical protein
MEMSERGSISEVLALPPYVEGGPNTHTLSLMTLLTAGLVAGVGVDGAISILHLVNIGLLVVIGFIVFEVTSRFVGRVPAAMFGLATVVFPLMVAQSAYLYTELASAAFVMVALYVASREMFGHATLWLIIAVAVKPLAVVAIPALMVFAWRSGAPMRTRLVPLLATIGAIPAILVPVDAEPLPDRWHWASLIWARTAVFATEAPEVLVLLAATVAAGLRIRRKPEPGDLEWFWPICVLMLSFIAFFAITPLVTVGYVLLPRYAVMIVGPAMILLGLLVRNLSHSGQIGIAGVLIVMCILGTRGPLAWGSNSPVPVIAERSLAFVELFEDHRTGMTRMAELSREGTPIFVDHYGGFGFDYPELGHFHGEVRDWMVVRSFGFDPSVWGADLDELPDRFAMLAEAPMLGSDRFRIVHAAVSADDGYVASEEVIGTAYAYPIEVITVERIGSDER